MARAKARKEVQAGRILRVGPRERLRKVRGGSVVSLVAPAGYGKTLLLQSWIDSDPACVAWVDAEAGGAPLADRLRAAVASALPGHERAIRATASMQQLLEAAQGRYLIIVIDDVHEVTAADDLTTLGELTSMVPRTVLVVLAGRCTPRAGLSRPHAAGTLVTFGAEDLVIRSADLVPLALSAGESNVAEVLRLTGGWPIALRYGLSMANDEGSPQRELAALMGYLNDEVLKRADPALLELLEVVAILHQADCDEIDHVRDRNDSRMLQQRLLDHPMPLVRVGPRFISVHPLVRQAFAARLRLVDSQAEARILLKCASFVAAHGDAERGFALVQRARDKAALAAYAYDEGRKLAVQGRGEDVRRWLQAFSPDELQSMPQLQVLCMIVDGSDGNFAAVKEWLFLLQGRDLSFAVKGDMDATSPADLVAEVLGARSSQARTRVGMGWWSSISRIVSCFEAIASGDFATAEGISTALAPFTVRTPLLEIWRAAGLAYIHVMRGEGAAALRVLQDAQRIWDATGRDSNPLTVGLDVSWALTLASVGRRPEGESRLTAALAKLPVLRAGLPHRTGFIYVAAIESAVLLGKARLSAELLSEVATVGLAPHDTFYQERLVELGGRISTPRPTSTDGISLTPKEADMLRHLESHQSVPVLAERLGRSPATLRTHIRTLYRKLGVGTRDEAVRLAHELGLLPVRNARREG